MGHVEPRVHGTHRELVIQRWPHAVAEEEVWPYNPNATYWTVWDIPRLMTHGTRWNGDVAQGRMLLGQGMSEDEVWLNAYCTVRSMEGWP